MNETIVCTVGNVATQPVHRELPSGASARFRLAVTSRYWDREKNVWTDGHTNFFTVWANRRLADNTVASLNVGDPVIVQGRLKVRTETRDGTSRTWADIDALAIGHDLARGTTAFRRTARTEPQPVSSPPRPEPTWETPLPDAHSPQRPEPAAAVTG
ncbi:single-stranded DNA-binding protein [Streptomyces triticisoli]|jgi:single-strand DNA-binding protein|uniref:single-stranded DNA-binding protein n=1 Tax=Streptomyces triticisoli TaxID=2182797 RepID=UPI000DD8E058|nr:single-stranded DNA-binding protein [Streptomyces triticisoli]